MQEEWEGVSFWAHVEDLRHTLLRSFLIVGVGFLFMLAFYQPIVQFLATYPTELNQQGLLKHRVQRIQIINQSKLEQTVDLPLGSWLISEMIPGKNENNAYRLAQGKLCFTKRRSILPC